MKFQNKKVIKILFIIIIIFIILFGIFYFYNYKYNNNNENFTILQSIYTGEPSPTGNYIPKSDNTYVIPNLQAVTSNNIGLYGLDTNNILYYYSSNDKKWNFFSLNINPPQITNPQYDNSINNRISCTASDGLELASCLSTLWIYSNSANNINKMDCIFFISLTSDGSIPQGSNIYCLRLPLLTSRMRPTTTMNSALTTTYSTPLQPFDNIRLLAANQNVLFALGCYDSDSIYNMQTPPSPNDRGIYYYILKNGFPINGAVVSGWQFINLPYTINRTNITKLIVNDSYIFLHTSKYDINAANGEEYTYDIFHMPIIINNNIVLNSIWSNLSVQPEFNSIYGIKFENLFVNNDIIYGISQDINSFKTNIWWRPLSNKGFITSNNFSDPSYSWKKISLDTFGTIDIVLYNNKFIVFGSTDSSNYVIPLKGTFTPSSTINYSTEVTNSTETGVTSSGGTVTTTKGFINVGNAGNSTTTNPNTGNTATTNPNTTNPNTNTGNSTTTKPNTGNATTTKPNTGNITPLATLNSLLSNSNLNLHASGNTDNLNDFMAKNTLIGSNVYLSPMNDTGLYMPSKNESNQKKNRNITSNFNPSVDIL